jgi:hypothetical protein
MSHQSLEPVWAWSMKSYPQRWLCGQQRCEDWFLPGSLPLFDRVEASAPLEEHFAGYDIAPGDENWGGYEDHCRKQEFPVDRRADIPLHIYEGK